MAVDESVENLPFEEAIDFFREKVNVPTERWLDVQGAAHSHAFSVAGAASDALVADFRAEIDKALAEGTTLDEFRAAFDDIVARHGWEHTGDRDWRARGIYETNMRTAYAAGRYAQLTLPETLAVWPYWQYNHSGAVHPRRDHLSWDGLTIRADDPFWDVAYPPNGFGCGCFVIPADDADLDRQGKSRPDHAPDLDQPAGGTRGVDQSFDYNPGRAWLSGGRPGESLATGSMMDAFERAAVDGSISARASLPIADPGDTLRGALGLEPGAFARVSAQTIRDHLALRDHGVGFYARAAVSALDAGIRRSPRGLLSAIVTIGGKPHMVGFKRTRNAEFLVTTVHRARPKQVSKVLGWPLVRE